MKSKIWPEDKWFSLCVRERADWTCERCHKKFPENAQNLHASHFVSRRKRSTRWDPANVFAHCFVCHQYLGENPGEFTLWIDYDFGEVGMAHDLVGRGHKLLKVTARQREGIANHYRLEYKRMRSLRDAGTQGRIEFADWAHGTSGTHQQGDEIALEKAKGKIGKNR